MEMSQIEVCDINKEGDGRKQKIVSKKSDKTTSEESTGNDKTPGTYNNSYKMTSGYKYGC